MLSTLVLASVVLVVVGVVIAEQVGRDLVREQQRSALAEVEAGLRYAEASGATSGGSLTGPSSASTDQRVQALFDGLERGQGSSALFSVVLQGATGQATYASAKVFSVRDVPPGLAAQVEQGRLAYQYARPAGAARALLAGAPLTTTAGPYALYYAFPLGPQEQTLALVRRRLLTGGAALALLLTLVAFVVARQVTRPVRRAASVAERLAHGDLEQRMPVRGVDDIARLGGAFNAMASGLQRQIGQLEELSRLQQRFTADVSHELRTPLTTVRMAADVLHHTRASFPREAARATELLSGELDRFEALLGDLLEISRYDAGAATLEAEPSDLVFLTRDVVERLAPVAVEAGVSVQLDLPEGPVLAEVDARRVGRVLRNLVANALEHAEGRAVEVVLAADADVVAVRVTDHGLGLRPGDAERVFDRFWRADASRARASGGTGLGLSIALEDARLHGGWLHAWGAPGHGAAFRLVVPRRAGEPVRSAPLPLHRPLPRRADPAPLADPPGERPVVAVGRT